ncbi:MAG: aldehyde dehydrogenase family protein [Gammaproteobacteria bacterium]|nr:aldehyde dehydrogenase family protein [Gammaproteobacteria bacterium]
MNLLEKLGILNYTDSSGSIVSYNPTNGEAIANVNHTTLKKYQEIVERAQVAFQKWRQVPAPKRGELIRHIADRLRACKSDLGSLVSLEMGKSKQEGDGEVQEMIDMADFAVGQSRMLYGKTMHSERPQHRMYEQWQPLGVNTIITAFNFPVAVWAWNAFLAVICGNTVIWKPSPKTPLCALAVQHICDEVMQQHQLKDIFSLCITEDLSLSKEMVDDVRIPLVSFTGSSKVGIEINQRVAKRMGRCLLECSGNNALIIDESANLDLALMAVLFGATGTCGQRCTTTRRLIIHQKLYKTITEKLTKAYATIKIGDPLDEKNHMGPLIDKAAVDTYSEAIERIKKLGGNILYGGNKIERSGYFVEPTLVEAHNDWDIVQQETFAPILYCMSFDTIEQAIQLQNQSCYGLSSALFTNNLQHSELFLSSQGSDCGIANINIGTSGAEIGGAFGGEKLTGGGREAGSDAWKTYMRRQTNTINWGHDLPLAQGITHSLDVT